MIPLSLSLPRSFVATSQALGLELRLAEYQAVPLRRWAVGANTVAYMVEVRDMDNLRGGMSVLF